MIKIATGALKQSGRNVRMNLNGGAKQKSTARLVGAKPEVILSACICCKGIFPYSNTPLLAGNGVFEYGTTDI